MSHHSLTLTLGMPPFATKRWLKRDDGGNEIENFLKSAPFENYPLFLGAEKLKGGVRMFRQMSRRKVKPLSQETKVRTSSHTPCSP